MGVALERVMACGRSAALLASLLGPAGCVTSGSNRVVADTSAQLAASGCVDRSASWQTEGRDGDRVRDVTELGEDRYLIAYEARADQAIEVTRHGARPLSLPLQDDAHQLSRWVRQRLPTDPNADGVQATAAHVFVASGAALFEFSRAEGELVASREFGEEPSRAYLVAVDEARANLLVAFGQGGRVRLLELRTADLSTARELTVAGASEERSEPWDVIAAGESIYVPSLGTSGVRLTQVRRADLSVADELWLPLPGGSDDLAGVSVEASASGRWLSVQRGSHPEQVLVVDASVLQVAQRFDADGGADVEFSPDERIMSFTTGCACEGTDLRLQTFAPLDAPNRQLQLRWKDYASFAFGPGFLWAISADLKRVLRWDFADLQRVRSYDLHAAVRSTRHTEAFSSLFEQYDGEVFNYPVDVAFDRRGELLVAEWDGQHVRVSKVGERRTKTVFEQRSTGVAFVALNAAADLLVVVQHDGAIRGFDMEAPCAG